MFDFSLSVNNPPRWSSRWGSCMPGAAVATPSHRRPSGCQVRPSSFVLSMSVEGGGSLGQGCAARDHPAMDGGVLALAT
jgi:hypothetical protein